jgi:hypothetical protein
MARLTARQRSKLPRSAFVVKGTKGKRSTYKYPVPTKAQARKAGISERQRQTMHRAALSYSARRTTASSYRKVAPVVHRRSAARRRV